MTEALWQEVSALALRLPGRGKRSLQVTLCSSGEYVAMACVSTTTGSGVEECASALGTTAEGALTALRARLLGAK